MFTKHGFGETPMPSNPESLNPESQTQIQNREKTVSHRQGDKSASVRIVLDEFNYVREFYGSVQKDYFNYSVVKNVVIDTRDNIAIAKVLVEKKIIYKDRDEEVLMRLEMKTGESEALTITAEDIDKLKNYGLTKNFVNSMITKSFKIALKISR